MYGLNRETFLKQLKQNPEMFNSLSHQAVTEKVVTFLKENNEVKLTAKKG